MPPSRSKQYQTLMGLKTYPNKSGEGLQYDFAVDRVDAFAREQVADPDTQIAAVAWTVVARGE